MEAAEESGPGPAGDDTPFRSSFPTAPEHILPHVPIVSVEHRCIVKDFERGLASLGGANNLKELVRDQNEAVAKFYLRPGDRMFKPLLSTNVKTNDVLLKFTVPKRTGLKRKRGSQDPFCDDAENGNGASSSSDKDRSKQGSMTLATQRLVRSLRENPTSYQVQAVGKIERTHRFRGMPDFVVSTVNMPFMKKLQQHILPFDYDKMKGFTLDKSKGTGPNTEISPPPRMSHIIHPFNYSYRQNYLLKRTVDQFGNVTATHLPESRKILTQIVPFDTPKVPVAPMPNVPQIESLDLPMQRLIASVRRLLEDRPICTRRVITNLVPSEDSDGIAPNAFKRVYQYCGYSFSSGPWRDTIVKYGLEPRKDAKYRVYQTMMFQLENEPKDNRARYVRRGPDTSMTNQIMQRESHIFDGENVSKDGKVWQVCDITDPFLRTLLATPNVRDTCHIESDGWYHNGTWAKAKVIMKAKLQAILTETPQQGETYTKVVDEMPEIIRPQDRSKAKLGPNATPYATTLATQVRQSAFIDRLPIMEKTSTQEEDDDEDREEGPDYAIASHTRRIDVVLDPRLTEAAQEMEVSKEDMMPVEGRVDDMDIDAFQSS